MKLLNVVTVTIPALGVLMGSAFHAQAQNGEKRITASRVARPEGQMTGEVYVTIGGKELKIAEAGVDAWVIQGGRKAVYSRRDGSGGFENEGMSLHAYDAGTGKQRKIMSEYFGVDEVTEVTTTKKKTALLVDMSDGGLGGHYLAVVDPNRGEVFFRRWAKVLSRRGDMIVIGRYKEDDWEKFMENKKVTPYKKERYNLNALLARRVIVNKKEQ
jgi:hypothetical protein